MTLEDLIGEHECSSEDNPTASADGESFGRVLQPIRDAYFKASQQARKTDAGTGSAWELSGYVHLLDDAIKNARIHHKRALGIDRQIARAAAAGEGTVV